MMKKRRLLSLVLATVMVFSAFSAALPTFAVTAQSVSKADVSYLKSPDPGVTVSCTEITWIAAEAGSLMTGNVIVPATKSGLPYASAGESPEYTTIRATFTNLPDEKQQPTIACTNGGKGIVMTTPTFDKNSKTYTWSLLNGQSADGNILEFSITYKFNGQNYTNRAYSFVRGISHPAGFALERSFYTTHYVGDFFGWAAKDKATVSFYTSVMGRNTYSSMPDLGASNAELHRTIFNPADGVFYMTTGSEYSVVRSLTSETTTSTSGSNLHTVAVMPITDVYIDTSVTSSLADLNLRVESRVPNYSGDNAAVWFQTCARDGLINGTEAMGNYGIYMLKTWVIDVGNSYGFNNINSVSARGQSTTSPITGSKMDGSFTIFTLGRGESGSGIVYLGGSTGVVLHTVNKASLRNTINKIWAGTLYHDDNPLSSFGLNKGVQPQQWQFKAGWSDFIATMRDAQATLLNPKASQSDINAMIESLESAYSNLVIKKADYDTYDEYAILVDKAFMKEQTFVETYGEKWFVPETLKALHDAVDNCITGCNILYQPQVDAWTQAIIEAYNGLRVLPADYSRLNEVVEQANILAADKLEDGSSIYVNFSDVAAAVASVRYDLTKENQTTIEQYITNINSAIAALEVRLADYTKVELATQAAKNLKAANYTNFSLVRSAVNAVRYNLRVTEQARVDTFAENINKAISQLNPKDGNYQEIEEKIAEVNALVEEYYTPESYQAVKTAVQKCSNYKSFNILEQARIDAYVTDIQKALNELVMLDADYTRVNAAVAQWEAIPETEIEKFQEASIQAINSAVSSVIYGLKIDKQDQVDEFAEKIETALQNIEYLAADYTKVNTAIGKIETLDRDYWADFSGVDNAVNAINWNLGLNRQDEVDAYATAIYDAINQLVPGPADYSRVNSAIARFEALNKNHYTLESLQEVENVINSINWNLTKENQTMVIVYAFDINDAILDLVEADADYKELNKVMERIPSNADALYTAQSLKPLKDIVAEINWSLKAKEQDNVDGYVDSINEAMKHLVYLPGDYSEVDRQIEIARGFIENGIPQQDGSVYEVSKESAKAFEAYVANIDRSFNIIEVDEIAKIAKAVEDQAKLFKFAESIHHSKILLDTDKKLTYQGDIITVSVKLQSEYYLAATAIPVLYNSEYYDIVGSGVNAFAFEGSFAEGSEHGGNTTSPDKGYPASYTAQDKSTWKYAYITLAPNSQFKSTAVMPTEPETVATFQLKVKESLVIGDTPLDSRIWIDNAFQKTDDNKGGKLYVGRYETEAVNLDYVSYGQFIDLGDADLSVKIYDENSPAVFTELEAAIENEPQYDESFYTEETYEAYILALDEALAVVGEQESYTIKDQATVDEITNALLASLDALVLKDADTAELEEAVALTPEYEESLYVEETYETFTQAVAAGNAILSEEGLTIVDNDRIAEAVAAIYNALDALTLKEFSYMDDILVIIYEIYPMYSDEDYDEETLYGFYDALDACAMFADEGPTILQDEEGLELINDFYAKYIALEKSALQKVIDECVPEYGEEVYTLTTYSAFKAALEAANSMVENEQFAIEDIQFIPDCCETLKSRFEELELLPFDYVEEVYNALDLWPQDEEHTVQESLDAYYEAYDALDAFVSEYGETWSVINNEEALILIQNLRDAYDNLVIAGANTADLREACTTSPDYDESFYTEESYKAYSDAVEAGILLYDVTYDKQDEVDAATDAIWNAFDALVLKPFSKLTDVEDALKVMPQYPQTKYDAALWNVYASAYNDLYRFTLNTEAYTILDDQDALDAIEVYNTALADLEENGVIPDADYTIVTAAIENANKKLLEMQQTGNELVGETVTALEEAIAAVDYELTGYDQDLINEFATAIDEAAANLKYVPKIITKDEYKDVVTFEEDYILGLTDIASEEDITKVFGNIGDATLEVIATENGYGTGTVVKLVDLDGETISEYVIVVTADADGDGFVDSFDQSVLTELINSFEDPESEAVFMALDIVNDGFLDATDLAYVIYFSNYEM